MKILVMELFPIINSYPRVLKIILEILNLH